MTWIEYALRKPEPEPGRMLLIRFSTGNMDVYGSAMVEGLKDVTHWAEIEGPVKPSFVFSEEPVSQEYFDEITKALGSVQVPQQPPDPFEEWWASVSHCFKYPPSSGIALESKIAAKGAWDAAVKHMAAADDGLEGLDDTQKLVFKIVRQLANEIKNRDKLKHMAAKEGK